MKKVMFVLSFLLLSGCSLTDAAIQKAIYETQTSESLKNSEVAQSISMLPSKLVFNSDRDGNVEIYSMNPDGSEITRLTNSPFFDGAPDWSPDSRYIVFLTDRDGNAEIYRMDADGSNLVNLSNNPYDDAYPDWSPDMEKIVFESVRDGNLEIYVMNADGSGQTRLTNNPGDDYGARWSPDGSQIAFSSVRSGNLDVYLMNPDGSEQVNITNHIANDCNPTWSWEGSKLAFDTDRDGNYEIYSMNRDGSGATRLTFSAGNYGYSDWSPDGRRIVFSVDNGGNWDIYAMDYDGGNITEILTGQTGDFNPRWSPGTTTLSEPVAVYTIPTLVETQTTQSIPPAVPTTSSFVEETGWIEVSYSGTVDLTQPTPKALDQIVIFHGQNTVGAGFSCQGCYALEPAIDFVFDVPTEDINGSDIVFRTGEEYQYLIRGYLRNKTVSDFFAGSLPVFEVTYLERLK